MIEILICIIFFLLLYIFLRLKLIFLIWFESIKKQGEVSGVFF
jgi:hypothetical protein